MDAQVTNTTLFRIRRMNREDDQTQGVGGVVAVDYDWMEANQNWADIRGRLDKLTYSGEDSLRAHPDATAVADNFRLMPEAVAAVAHTGACTRQVPIFDAANASHRALHPFSFTFAARCSVDGNLIGIRLILRSAADNPIAYWNAATNMWVAANTRNDFGMTTMWRRYGVVTSEVPNVFGGAAVENMVWQVSNASAAAQFIDLDDFQINDLDQSYAA
jgi:hypothetical protein